MTARDRLDAIQQRADAATEGPWRFGGLDDEGLYFVRDNRRLYVESIVAEHAIEEDAEFIAHARQDVPALVGALRAVRKRLTDYADHGSIDRSVLDEIVRAITDALGGEQA